MNKRIKEGKPRSIINARERKQYQQQLQEMKQLLQPSVDPPGVNEAQPPDVQEPVKLGDGKQLIRIATARQPTDAFKTDIWTRTHPKSFPFGDGVFGLRRRSTENNILQMFPEIHTITTTT